MKTVPTTPYWLKKAAWFAAAFLGVLAAIVLCTVEYFLDAAFPYAFLILCVVQCAGCICSGILCGGRSTCTTPVRILYGASVLLTVLVLVLAFNWILLIKQS